MITCIIIYSLTGEFYTLAKYFLVSKSHSSFYWGLVDFHNRHSYFYVKTSAYLWNLTIVIIAWFVDFAFVQNLWEKVWITYHVLHGDGQDAMWSYTSDAKFNVMLYHSSPVQCENQTSFFWTLVSNLGKLFLEPDNFYLYFVWTE